MTGSGGKRTSTRATDVRSLRMEIGCIHANHRILQRSTPKSWDEFEDITLSASKLRWDSTDFFRYGRQGQKQDGVDIWGTDDQRRIGVQCKNTIEGITLQVIKAEVSNTDAFKPKLDRLYIATTAKRDAPLQKIARELSRTRRECGRFRVDILFWDDICGDLARDEEIFFTHYPQFRQGTDLAKEHNKKLFDELTNLLRSDGVIGFLDQSNMAGFAFREKALEPLREFYYVWNMPEREFVSADLENIRSSLWQKIDSYYDVYSKNTFACNNPELHTVPPEWESTQPERFWRVVNELHSLAGEIVHLHGKLIRKGREIFVGFAHRSSTSST